MKDNIKKILFLVVVFVLVAAGVVWMILNPGPEHIEDTNGADNYSLQQITEQDVIENKMGTRGGIATTEMHWNFGLISVSDGIKYSCRKFTGVYLLNTCTIFKGSDIHVYVADFKVNSGNFAFYVVLDGEIVGEVKSNEDGVAEFIMEDIEKTGTLEYFIAGESADFSFICPVEW